MSVQILASEAALESAPDETVGTGAVIEGSAPVLITHQQVMFATAAAVLPRQRTAGTRWWTAIGRFFTAADDARGTDDERRTPRVYPSRRSAFMEYAAMSREMDRL